jgi:hypothetical protein
LRKVEPKVEVEVEVAGIIPIYKDPGGQILTKKMSPSKVAENE